MDVCDMRFVTFRFYEELNDYLEKKRNKIDFQLKFKKNTSLKQIIESLGIPCDEIDLILVNGEPATFDRQINEGDRVSVYPVFERFDIEGTTLLENRPLRRPRFISDPELWHLSEKLKDLGLDILFIPGISITDVIQEAVKEGRIIITMRNSLKESKSIPRILFLNHCSVDKQINQILNSMHMS
jgi:hypothetical protein